MPKRLLAQGQPIYYDQVDGGGYAEGKKHAQTWADYITYDLEHAPSNSVNAKTIEPTIDEGVRIFAGAGAEVASQGRRYSKRRMPW